MLIGLEIEFLSEDLSNVIHALENNGITAVVNMYNKYSDINNHIIKYEPSIKGCEITISPYKINELQTICSALQNITTFVDNCALHIHISDEAITQESLDTIFNYYKRHEEEIIQNCIDNEMYVNLNSSVKRTNYYGDFIPRKLNMNIYRAFKDHGTIEHRIYKATFDYNKIIWCINQTKDIIQAALS